MSGGDEQNSMVGHALGEATGTAGKKEKRKKNDVSDQDVVVMGSGNLGLVYLMEERRRLTLEEMNERHPDLIPALRNHPHIGWLLVRSSEHGPLVLGGNGTQYLADGRVEGDDPLADFSPNAPATPASHRRVHPRRRHHDRQLLRPGARDRLRVRGADLVPRRHRRPADAAVHPPSRGAAGARQEELVGAAAVHETLLGWRHSSTGNPGRRCGVAAADGSAARSTCHVAVAMCRRRMVLVDLREPPYVLDRPRRVPYGARRVAVRRGDLVPRAVLPRAPGDVRGHDSRPGASSSSSLDQQDLVAAIGDTLDLSPKGRRGSNTLITSVPSPWSLPASSRWASPCGARPE